ncbi:MAG: tetratricopeptide (TPR) repeat protein [Gammaproteobacteria bacterium]|jgi:tetratricopeptide (TPR) repeat protein
MNVIQISILLLATALAPNVVIADQTDPRLDKLFFNLKINADLASSQQLTSDIWSIWSEHNKKEINILFNDGENAMYKKEYEAALKSFNKIVELTPNFAEGWNKRATVYFLMGDYHASLADIEKTLRLEPRHFGALSGRGQCYFELQKFESALNAFEAALEVNPWLYDVSRNIEIMKRLLDQQT